MKHRGVVSGMHPETQGKLYLFFFHVAFMTKTVGLIKLEKRKPLLVRVQILVR